MEPLRLGEALVLHLCFVWFPFPYLFHFSGYLWILFLFLLFILCSVYLFVVFCHSDFCLVLFCLLLFCSVLVVLLSCCPCFSLFCCFLVCFALFLVLICPSSAFCFRSNPPSLTFLHITPKLFPDMLFDTWVALSTLGYTIWNDIVLVVFNAFEPII